MQRSLMTALVLAIALPAAAAAPTAQAAVEKMTAAAGGLDAFSSFAMVTLQVAEDESAAGGRQRTGHYVAHAATVGLAQLRLDMGKGTVIARNGGDGWAMMGGTVDTRPQTPAMAFGTANQRLFPLLLPFSLGMDGVAVGAVAEGTWDGKPAWRLDVDFTRNFFASPVMQTTWQVYAAKSDWSLLGAEFQPVAQFAGVAEGVRYRVLRTAVVKGVRLPTELLMEGIDANRVPNGHNRTVTITAEPRPWDASLFIDPQHLEAMDEDDDDILDPGGR